MLQITKKALAAAILFAFALGLSACGQKGDLYHPPETHHISQPKFQYHA